MLSSADLWILEVTRGVPARENVDSVPEAQGKSCTPTHEVHDFQPIPFGKISLGPLIPGDDISVQLDRNAIRLQAHLLDQREERKWRLEAFLFPVDLQFHLVLIFASKDKFEQGGQRDTQV